MFNSFPSIRVTFLVGFVTLALPVPRLQAQTRSLGMRPGMAMQPMVMSPTVSGQLPPALLPAALAMNPTLGFGSFGNLGSPFASPFANPFGTGVLGGGFYGPNSRLGRYGYSSGYAGGLSYGPLYLPGFGGTGYGGPSPAKPKEPKVEPRNDLPQDERRATPRKPDDQNRQSPSDNEILSGKALNGMLDGLRRFSADGDSKGRPNALLQMNVDELKHVNVTRGPGSMALLKNGGRLNWPTALLGPVFQEPRERLAARASEAFRDQGSDGQVDPATIRQMADDVNQLRQRLRQNVGALDFYPYTEAKAFLKSFDDALVALQQPDAARHFDGQYALKAQTVLGLVKHMAENGLRFAPALPGDEAAYRALHQVIFAYSRTALAQAATQ
jgi:hypothetical protein